MLRSYLSSCLNCGSFFVRKTLLCAYCEEKILRSDFCQMDLSVEKTLPVYSLFEWSPGKSDILSGLIRQLKGSRQQEAWTEWARLFLNARLPWTFDEQETCFVPAPSLGDKRRHALYFAEALACDCGARILTPLSKVSVEHQRGFNRRQRESVRIQSAVNFADEFPDVRCVLIDDILTTGSTVLACYEALGKPANFEVWVLGKRGVACEVPMDLL